MLTFLDLKNDLYRMIGLTSSTTARDDIKQAVRLAILKGQQAFAMFGDWGFLGEYRNEIYVPIGNSYTTGTVTVTGDSKTVTGSGTAWTSAMVGRFFRLTSKEFYEIQSVSSTVGLVLAIPYQGTTAAGETYEIMRKYYDLPLNFLRPYGRQAKLQQVGFESEWIVAYDENVATRNFADTGRPSSFALVGNVRGADYFNTGTVTIATTSTVSTWTISTGTLPTDIVDREVRISGEDRAYRIATHSAATTFTTYETYVNPTLATNVQVTASAYAITPKDTKQFALYPVATENEYIFSLPYVMKLPELLLDADVSIISLAGYDEALLSECRRQLAIDGRTAIRADMVQSIVAHQADAMARAWGSEVHGNTLKQQAEGVPARMRQMAPSWLAQ